MNTALTVSASTMSNGNKFWNCHTAIRGLNLLRLHVENSLFRSTQSTVSTVYQQGNTAILLPTNRFQYEIKDNEFTNINTCIHIPMSAGLFTSIAQGTLNGIYAHKINIQTNTLTTGGASPNYINQAIRISYANNYPFTYIPDFTVSPNVKGIIVQENTLENVFRGIYVNGITGFETSVRDNTVSMRVDNTFIATQHGIDFSNTWSAANIPQQIKCTGNYAQGTNAGSMEAVYFVSMNNGLEGPYIACNKADASYQGFVFSGPNTPTPSINGTQWLGNRMSNLSRGMVLTTTAIIGAQGHSLLAMGNIWEGNTWSATGDLNTYTQNSNAGLSPLWCAPGSTYNPPFNYGQPLTQSYQGAGNTPTIVPGGAQFSCTDPSARSATFDPKYGDLSEDMWSILNSGLFRFLRFNDSIKSSNTDLANFYSNYSTSNLEVFAQIEKYLYQGDYSNSYSLLTSGMTPTNNVESNAVDFYTLYTDYVHNVANNYRFSSSDSLNLLNLSMLCPEESGHCVYQARALYEHIYLTVPFYPGCNSGTGARPLKNSVPQDIPDESSYEIYPNPNNGTFILSAAHSDSEAEIKVYDCTGKLVTTENVKFHGATSELDLELASGLYQVVITTLSGIVNTKKLLISY